MLAGCSSKPELWSWNGIVFGTEVWVSFAAKSEREAEYISRQCTGRTQSLEQVFTLYQGDSALRRLNRDGVLADPPKDLIRLLGICSEIHKKTSSAFDVTVQPLWELYENHFVQNPGADSGPPQSEIDRVRNLIGFEQVKFSEKEIRFLQPGMAITLNGIAQGFVCDEVALVLKTLGVEHALIQIGEYRAIGSHPDGIPWRVGIASGKDEEELLDVIDLEDRSLATSAGYGFQFDEKGGFHHLFHPKKSDFKSPSRVVSVLAPEAAWADGLATAGAIMDEDAFLSTIETIDNVEARIF